MAKQLTLAQRYHIAIRLSEGKMQKDIAKKDCHISFDAELQNAF
jgi:hypothetical protein